MPPIVLFLLFTAVICAVLFAVWRYWGLIANVSPEEEEFDERMTDLNNRQANRLSDDQLTHPLSDDDAWGVMVRRGLRDRERRRRPARDTKRRALPAPRRERYGGDLARRVDERRERQDEEPRRLDERRRPPERADD